MPSHNTYPVGIADILPDHMIMAPDGTPPPTPERFEPSPKYDVAVTTPA